jgi:hypothetical protein
VALIYFFTFLFAGAVGLPFPGVEVLIAQPDVYAKNGYNVVAQGSSRSAKVTPGKNLFFSAKLLLQNLGLKSLWPYF